MEGSFTGARGDLMLIVYHIFAAAVYGRSAGLLMPRFSRTMSLQA